VGRRGYPPSEEKKKDGRSLPKGVGLSLKFFEKVMGGAARLLIAVGPIPLLKVGTKQRVLGTFLFRAGLLVGGQFLPWRRARLKEGGGEGFSVRVGWEGGGEKSRRRKSVGRAGESGGGWECGWGVVVWGAAGTGRRVGWDAGVGEGVECPRGGWRSAAGAWGGKVRRG